MYFVFVELPSSSQITHGLLMRIFCMCYLRWTELESFTASTVFMDRIRIIRG